MSSSPHGPWRSIVRAAAREAAMIEDQGRWGDARTPFHYRWEHICAAVRLSVQLAELTGADCDVCEAAAWLHDVAKPHSRDHGHDGAAQAREILAQTDFPTAKVEPVADAIAKHVGLQTCAPIEPLEAAVLWDADKLSKLGATIVLHGIGAALAKGCKATADLVKEVCDDQWGEGIVRSLNTAPARAAGRERLHVYRAFCHAARVEFDGLDLHNSEPIPPQAPS